MNKHKSNKMKENSNTVRHMIMGQITTTQNFVAIKEVRQAGQKQKTDRLSQSLGPYPTYVNDCACIYHITLRPRQIGHHFVHDS